MVQNVLNFAIMYFGFLHLGERRVHSSSRQRSQQNRCIHPITAQQGSSREREKNLGDARPDGLDFHICSDNKTYLTL